MLALTQRAADADSRTIARHGGKSEWIVIQLTSGKDRRAEISALLRVRLWGWISAANSQCPLSGNWPNERAPRRSMHGDTNSFAIVIEDRSSLAARRLRIPFDGLSSNRAGWISGHDPPIRECEH